MNVIFIMVGVTVIGANAKSWIGMTGAIGAALGLGRIVGTTVKSTDKIGATWIGIYSMRELTAAARD